MSRRRRRPDRGALPADTDPSGTWRLDQFGRPIFLRWDAIEREAQRAMAKWDRLTPAQQASYHAAWRDTLK